MKKILAILKSLLISIASSLLICFLPIAPLFSIISGTLGAYFFHIFSLVTHKNKVQNSYTKDSKIELKTSKALKNTLPESDFILFSALSSIINGLLIGYIFTLMFYLNLEKPPEDSWLKLEFVENLLRNTPEFRINLFIISAFISGLMNYLGTFIIFRFGIGLSKPEDTELMNKMKNYDLTKYLEKNLENENKEI